MKKLLIMVMMSLLAACGGGGESGTTTTNVTPGGPTGTLVLTFDNAQAKTLAAIVPGTVVRVAISNSLLRFDGAPFRVIDDQTAGAAGATFSFDLPVASGYIIEVITSNYDSSTGVNTIGRYGVAKNITINLNQTTGVPMTFTDVSANAVFPPAGVYQGSSYAVMPNLSTALGRAMSPLATAWYLAPPKAIQSQIAFSNRTTGINYSYLTTHTQTAPYPGVAGTKVYMKGLFTLKQSLLKTGEPAKRWAFYGNYSTPVKVVNNLQITIPVD